MEANKPKLIMIAGPNGSGKTTVTNRMLLDQWAVDCLYINADNIAQEKYGDWNSPEAVLKAAQLATEMRETYLQEKQSFIFETVFSGQDKIDFIKRAKSEGFFIRVFFIGTNSPDINIARVAQRVKEGGHTVPEDKIVSRYYKSIENCASIASIVDRLYVFDNSKDFSVTTEGIDRLFRVWDGKIEKLYQENINQWAMPIFDALKK